MEAGERLASGVGVGRGLKGGPGEGVLIEVNAGGNLVNFVGPVGEFDCGLAGGVSEDAGDGRAVGVEVSEEAMLFEQAFFVAN